MIEGKMRIPADVAVGLDKLDKDKADAALEHKYVLEIPANKDLPEEDKIYVICRYLTQDEMERVIGSAERNGDDAGNLRIFKQTVKEIHNLLHPVEDREVTVDELVHSQYNTFIYNIFYVIARHLAKSSRLTRDERKNSPADAKQPSQDSSEEKKTLPTA